MAWSEKYVDSAAGGGGDGSSGSPWTLAEALTNYAAGDRLNVKAGTYSRSSSTAFSTSGTTTSPIWWRGYNTTIGDIDSDNTLTKPLISFSTGRMDVSGNYQMFSNIRVTSPDNSAALYASGANVQFLRMQITDTGSGVGVLGTDEKGQVFSRCLVVGGSSHGFSIGSETVIEGCVIRATSAVGIYAPLAFRNVAILRNIIDGTSSYGIQIPSASTGATITIDGNSIYNTGSDGVRFTALPAVGWVANNIFSSIGGYGINNASGTNTANIFRSNNLYHSITSGQENGFGDTPNLFAQTDSSSPFENAASDDFTPVTGSNAIDNASPGPFEGI